MLKSLLVGLNGAAMSDAVSEMAMRIGRSFQAELGVAPLVDVIEITKAEPVPLGASAFRAEREKHQIAEASAAAQGASDRLVAAAQGAGLRCESLMLLEEPRTQLMREAERFDAILLGQSIGDVSADVDPLLEHVVHHACRPVIAVPRTLPAGEATVIAFDGSLQAARTLQLFASLFPDRQNVHLLSIDKQAAQATKLVETAAAYLTRRGIGFTPHAITSASSPDSVILDLVREQNAELLVMGAYGKPVWRDFLFGSITRKLLGAGAVSVFLYH
jgi:nucleotide-binding universal stress UspA family protein